MDDDLMDEFKAADAAVRCITRATVLRHRAAGVLTWALLHQIEDEVLEEAAASGEHSMAVLKMMRAPDVMTYPKDERPASFQGHGFVPIVFSETIAAWNHVH